VGYLEKKNYEKAIEHCDIATSLGYEVAEELKAELAPHRK
jgi:hypothetical protein